MKIDIKHQERYSRGELLLRSIFGAIYIAFPHLFLLIFVSLWGAILSFISWWIVLFTGEYPQSFFEFYFDGIIDEKATSFARLAFWNGHLAK